MPVEEHGFVVPFTDGVDGGVAEDGVAAGAANVGDIALFPDANVEFDNTLDSHGTSALRVYRAHTFDEVAAATLADRTCGQLRRG